MTKKRNQRKNKRRDKAGIRYLKKLVSAHAGGSFTIEAALLFSILLPLMTALIISGMFVHDRAKMQGAACELAARGSCLVLDESRDSMLGKTADVVKKGTMWARNGQAEVSADEDHAQAAVQGSFPFPGYTSAFLTGEASACGGTWERRIYHPAELIRKVRGLKALSDQLTG